MVSLHSNRKATKTLRKYRQLMASGGGESVFSKGVVPGRCTTLQWIVSHPKVGGKQTLNLTGSLKIIKIKKFLKEDMKFKGRNLGGLGAGEG